MPRRERYTLYMIKYKQGEGIIGFKKSNIYLLLTEQKLVFRGALMFYKTISDKDIFKSRNLDRAC